MGRGSSTSWACVAAAIAGMAIAPAAGAEASTYLIGGVGFLSVGGEADAAVQREGGWTFCGGIRRRLTERISIGVSGEYAKNDLNARAFFDERDVFPTEPERHLSGGEMTLLGGSLDGLYEYPVDRSTVVYGKLGVGYYQWDVETVFVNVEALGVEGQVPARIDYESESGVGGHVGAGVRFPLGDSAGLWAEFAVEFIGGASGGSMQLVPLRAGISLP